jgi:N-acetylmuramoyl-L-alanine amidase
MTRHFLYTLAICFFVIPVLSFIAADTIKPTPKAPVRTVIIDPGHGGTFPGARGLISTEKEVSLSVALKFGKALQEAFPDIKVVYTRTTDDNAGGHTALKEDLRYRADLANSSGGDLFIAFHCNSAGKRPGGWYERVVVDKIKRTRTVTRKKKKVKQTYYEYKYQNVWRENVAHGTESYIWAVNKNDAKVNSIAKNNEYYGEIDSTSTEVLELPDPSDPAEKARMLVYAQQYFKKSLTLADMIESEFEKRGRVSRGVKQRNDEGIWVLQATGMPSVLVEIGFISNKEEEEYINSNKGQEEIVEDVLNAFKTYKQKQESRSSALPSN